MANTVIKLKDIEHPVFVIEVDENNKKEYDYIDLARKLDKALGNTNAEDFDINKFDEIKAAFGIPELQDYQVMPIINLFRESFANTFDNIDVKKNP